MSFETLRSVRASFLNKGGKYINLLSSVYREDEKILLHEIAKIDLFDITGNHPIVNCLYIALLYRNIKLSLKDPFNWNKSEEEKFLI